MKTMEKYHDNNIYKLLTDLAGIASVSPTGHEERAAAQYIYDALAAVPYFVQNPQDLKLLPLENDSYKRNFVYAVVKSAKKVKETVLLMGHMDVVSADVCGSLEPYAFNPEEYTQKIAATEISPDVRQDLETGEWLFGRGVADMKSGLSAGIDYIMEAAGNPDALDCNLAFVAVPDEENNSAGMLAAASFLAAESELKYLACVDLEPTFATEDRALPSIYLGSLGKINIFFYCLGKESHAGEYYKGFSAAPVMSFINILLDGNQSYADSFAGKEYPPFICMRQLDLRRDYSATIMTKGFTFYSYLSATKLPQELLAKAADVAREALDRAIAKYRENASSLNEKNGIKAQPIDWQPQVITFDALKARAKDILKEGFDAFVDRTLEANRQKNDERTCAALLVEEMATVCGIKPPTVIVGFLPPWYPHRVNYGVSEDEKKMRNIARAITDEAQKEFALDFEIRELFEGISDLSYCGFQGAREEMDFFAKNMPGWKKPYSLPVDALEILDIPILNMGPIGKDAHKNTERLYLPYAMEIYPQLLRKLVKKLAVA